MAVSGLYGTGFGLSGGLGQQQAAQGSAQRYGAFQDQSLGTITIPNGTTAFFTNCFISSDPAAARVQASLPRTLRAELQEEVDAWLPRFE